MAALVLANAGHWHAQRDRLHELFQAHKAEKDMLDRIADELPGGLKRSQVAAQLRKLGLRRPGAGGRGGGRADAAAVRANPCALLMMQPSACGSLCALRCPPRSRPAALTGLGVDTGNFCPPAAQHALACW